jgi:membrane-associated phospholipid phosphatase
MRPAVAALRSNAVPPLVAGPTQTAFQLVPAIDVPVLGLGAVFGLARFVRTTPAYCAPRCDAVHLNALDHLVAGRFSPAWATASDVGVSALFAGAAALLTLDEGLRSGLNDLVVVAEAGLLSTAVASLGTLPAGRPRPCLYGERAPLDIRMSADGALSFISSHTAVSFSIATSSFLALQRLHPRSAGPWVALGVGLAAAGSVGAARVLAGRHFPTDVLAGAAVGSSVGFLVPALHRPGMAIAPDVTPTAKGVVFVRAF